MQPLFYSPCPLAEPCMGTENLFGQGSISRELMLLAAINEQFLLTQHLIQVQSRLTEELKKEKQSSDSGQSSLANNQNNIKRSSMEQEEDFKFASENNDESSSHKSPKEEEPLTRLRIKKVFKYEVESESQNSTKNVKKCETKNIIKNFIKSIFNFMRKHPVYIGRLAKHYDISVQQLMESIEKLDGKVNTIYELRQFWVGMPFSSIYRTISQFFLKRYNLKHIFHSRITNHQIHLKYRQKFLESLRKPEQFTSLKDF